MTQEALINALEEVIDAYEHDVVGPSTINKVRAALATVRLEKESMSQTTEHLIALLRQMRPEFGAVGSRDVDVARQQREIDEAIAMLSGSTDEAALATVSEAEPVAYMVFHPDGSKMGPYSFRPEQVEEMERRGHTLKPLFYAAAQGAESAEPIAEFAASQEPLPADVAKVLHDTAWDLYAGDKASAESAEKDAARLDWLEKNQQGVYPVVQTKRRATTMNTPRYEEYAEFLGWSLSLATDEHPTIRTAIDAAMAVGSGGTGGSK